MPDAADPTGLRDDTSSDATDTLAALIDGTLALDDVSGADLERVLRLIDSADLLELIASEPKLFPAVSRVTPRPLPARPTALVRRTHAFRLMTAAALLALVVGAGLYVRSRSTADSTVLGSAQSRAAASTVSAPTTTSNSVANAPIVLTARLPEADGRALQDFRGPASESHVPRSEGAVVSVSDDSITIDLGALDGVTKNGELRVYRGAHEPVGTVMIDRVFRDRARGVPVRAASLRPGDIVAIDPAGHVDALLSASSDRLAAGNPQSARTLAEDAVSAARAPRVSGERLSRALAQLAALEQRAGALDAAEQHLREAVQRLELTPTVNDSDILNQLAGVLIASRQYTAAETALLSARKRAEGVTAVRVANNLGAVAVLRSDLSAADQRYREALSLAGSAPELAAERQAIEKNLESLRAAR